MKINHRHFILIIFAFITITVSVLCYFFLYRKTTNQADNYLGSIKLVESEKKSVDYERKLIETFNKYEGERVKLQSYILKEDMLVGFIEMIEGIGTESKTDLELSAISNSDNKIKAKVLTIGTWENIMTALLLMENLPLSVSITNVRLDAAGEMESTSENDKKTVKAKQWRLSLDIEALTIK